ncbi:MAG TPA: hypothetical protein VNZ45_02685 [Bacteroidia bacterium]|jgi:hypothetical protein|nr:hypothetical protein [Bacteroidia bacterium]
MHTIEDLKKLTEQIKSVYANNEDYFKDKPGYFNKLFSIETNFSAEDNEVYLYTSVKTSSHFDSLSDTIKAQIIKGRMFANGALKIKI